MCLFCYRFKGERIAVWRCSRSFCFLLFLVLASAIGKPNNKHTQAAKHSGILLPESYAASLEFLATRYSELSEFTIISSRCIREREVP